MEQITTDQLYFRDPDTEPPPLATSILLLNPGGVLVVGPWTDDCVRWCPKPRIPRNIKDKLSKPPVEDETPKKYDILVAKAEYGVIRIEAKNKDEAIHKAYTMNVSQPEKITTFQPPEWEIEDVQEITE